MKPEYSVSLEVDPKPIMLFIELFKRALEASQCALDIGDLGFELARVETDGSATETGKLVIRLYPSDSFLDFAATTLAGDFDIMGIKES
jgi:hypothetical protein